MQLTNFWKGSGLAYISEPEFRREQAVIGRFILVIKKSSDFFPRESLSGLIEGLTVSDSVMDIFLHMKWNE